MPPADAPMATVCTRPLPSVVAKSLRSLSLLSGCYASELEHVAVRGALDVRRERQLVGPVDDDESSCA
jgi:hypothetical protein